MEGCKRHENKFFHKDLQFAMGVDRYSLYCIGLWPARQYGFRAACNTGLKVFNMIILCFVVVSVFLDLLTKDLSLDETIILITTLLYPGVCLLKYVVFILLKNRLEQCYTLITADWQDVEDTQERQIMLGYAKIGRYVSVAFIFGAYFTGLGYVILPIATYHSEKQQFENGTVVRPLPYWGDYFIPDITQQSPYYEITYFFLSYAELVMNNINIGTYTIPAKIIMHVSGLCNIVSARLDSLVDTNSKGSLSTLDRKMEKIFTSHLYALR